MAHPPNSIARAVEDHPLPPLKMKTRCGVSVDGMLEKRSALPWSVPADVERMTRGGLRRRGRQQRQRSFVSWRSG